MNAAERLFVLSRLPVVGRVAQLALKCLGVEIPKSVVVDGQLHLPHWAAGLVVHPSTRIGHDVVLYQGVTIGRSDIYRSVPQPITGGVEIGDESIICAGAKVLFKSSQTLVIGTGTIVGANSVLMESTGRNEIWAGAPARRVGSRAAR